MVKFFEKKAEKEIFANGRIIVTDFRKLKKKDFPQYSSGDMLFLHYDGKIYIDSNNDGNEAIVMLLKMLVQYPMAELYKMVRERKKRFPNIKTVNDLPQLKENTVDFIEALAIFIIPVEIKSREVQKAYYG